MIKKLIQLFVFFVLNLSIIIGQPIKNNIIVGTKLAEPFVIKSGSGQFEGISFELWEKIAKELQLNYQIKVFNLKGLTDAVANNSIDIAVSPLTITSEREKLFDFTHAYFTTGLSIAVSNTNDSSILSIAKNLFSIQLIKIVLLILVCLLVVGILVWLFERKFNKYEFGDGKTSGLGSSLWWAAVTMTTVGYGDKAPKTTGGRIIALIWMFAGLVIISGFTAAITSALTVDKLDEGISSLSDLYNARVATVKSSSSEEFLTQNSIDYITVVSIEEGIEFINQNKIDALVYDAPILKYYIKTKNISNEVRVLPLILDPINYAYALPTNSPLKESINRILLREIDKVEWTNVINSYLGR